jgi:hypothetical protein
MHLETGPSSGSRSFNEIEFLDITTSANPLDPDLAAFCLLRAQIQPVVYAKVSKPEGTRLCSPMRHIFK